MHEVTMQTHFLSCIYIYMLPLTRIMRGLAPSSLNRILRCRLSPQLGADHPFSIYVHVGENGDLKLETLETWDFRKGFIVR